MLLISLLTQIGKQAPMPQPGSSSTPMRNQHESYMSEIQLRRIVDKMANETSSQGTDGDDVMQKSGETISKFSKDALEIETAVNEAIL
jgi:hypothetical protein